jgi:hypothetical protein
VVECDGLAESVTVTEKSNVPPDAGGQGAGRQHPALEFAAALTSSEARW